MLQIPGYYYRRRTLQQTSLCSKERCLANFVVRPGGPANYRHTGLRHVYARRSGIAPPTCGDTPAALASFPVKKKPGRWVTKTSSGGPAAKHGTATL